MSLRKTTKITLCRRHAGWQGAKSAAVMGGWAGGPCDCHCLPGTDTYIPSLVERFPRGFKFGEV